MLGRRLKNKVIFIYITTSRRFKCVIEKWVTPLDFVAWRLSLFLWAFTSAAAKSDENKIVFTRLRKGENFAGRPWREFKRQEQ